MFLSISDEHVTVVRLHWSNVSLLTTTDNGWYIFLDVVGGTKVIIS